MISWSVDVRHFHPAVEDQEVVEATKETEMVDIKVATLEAEGAMEIEVEVIAMVDKVVVIAMGVATLVAHGIQNQPEGAIAIEMKENKMEETKVEAMGGPEEANGIKKLSQLKSMFMRTLNTKSQRDATP